MTERLYLIDSEQFFCTATVTACVPCDKGYAVELDRSVFFPEKGGQPCDKGSLGTATVTDCQEVNDQIVHYCDKQLKVGKVVEVVIDQQRRMDIMRQHTGEHLISFFAWDTFKAFNVGFHCAMDYATLDLDKPLSKDDVERLENLTNDYALRNVPVTAAIFDSEDELRDIKLRKHTEGLTAPIRVVTIEGADVCTCCAPHVRHTGEIGLIKIVGAIAYKGGMRLTFLCGGRALRYLQGLQNELEELALMYSTSFELLPAAIRKQGEELSRSNKELKQATARLDEHLADKLRHEAAVVRGIQLIVTDVGNVEARRLRPLAQGTLEGKSLSVIFAPWGEQVNYIAACKGVDMDMNECIKAVNAALNGKGGGRGDMAQGSAKLTCDLSDTIEQLRHYFERLLG